MAENKTLPETATAEDRQQRIEEQTSVGKYVGKNLWNLAITAAGALTGFVAVKYGLLKSSKVLKAIDERVGGIKGLRPEDMARVSHSVQNGLKVLGGFFGLAAGSTVLGYGHWKNQESEKLAVAEINTDVGNLMEQRAHFAETVNRQENTIKELLAEREARGGSHTDRSTPAEPAVAQR